MFKIVKELVPKAQFLMMCDASCGKYASVQVPDGTNPEDPTAQVSFINLALKDGWKVGLDKQLCPDHARAEAGEAKQIMVATPAMVRLN